MPYDAERFPAFTVIDALTDALKNRNAIVAAPPGAGKSTVIPLALLSAFTDKKILLMQPRRVVVRSLSGYLAEQLNEPVGQRVGYRIRGETRVSEQTQLEVITEGILARRIAHDPELEDVGLIIFDEFHERSIHSDFGLALALDVQEGLREDLRLLVMSATLDTESLATLLPEAAICVSEGRMYDVQEKYSGQIAVQHLHDAVARYTRQACEEVDGDVLVFLPGVGAINKVSQLLTTHRPQTNPVIHHLYGALGKAQQNSALKADPLGRQKVILATNVAETSLTIDNIEAVIDSGLENIAVYNPATGLTQLNQQMIAKASATQRKGRAGRLKPGICIRLWSKEQQDRLSGYTPPQIHREDITPLLLDTLAWGTTLDALRLLDQPSAAQINSATSTLTELDAVTTTSTGGLLLTAYGQQLARFPCHPRLAHMLLAARDNEQSEGLKLCQAAAWVAALAEDSAKVSDGLVSEALINADKHTTARLSRQAKRFLSLLFPSDTSLSVIPCHELEPASIALAIALAWQDRIAHWQKEQWKMANGRGAQWRGIPVKSEWLAVLSGQQVGTDVRIRLAEPLTYKAIETWFPKKLTTEKEVNYHRSSGQMQARQVTRFHQIILSSEPVSSASADEIAYAWLAHLQALSLSELPLPGNARQWLNRVALAAKLDLAQPQAFDQADPWPDVNVSVLSLIDENSLISHLKKCKKREDLPSLPWQTLMQQTLSWPQQHALEHFLPTSVLVPSGNVRPLEYLPDGQVILAVKMQEMYGSNTQILIGNNALPVTLSLLSPAGRPLQKTNDLGAFWQGSYQEIKKEMKGRYPKHFWPDEPALAAPTTRTKKHMT